MITKILTFLLLVSSMMAFSDDDVLVKITNSIPDNERYTTVLKIRSKDDDSMVKLVKHVSENITGKVLWTTEYGVPEVKRGLVLESAKNPTNGSQMEVVKLTGPNLSSTNGGTLVIRYLNNGIINSYNEVRYDLLYKAGKWSLYLPGGGEIDHLHVEPNYGFIVGLIGIKDIVVQ